MCFCNLSITTITSQAAAKKATSIKLNAASKTLTVGQTYQLKVKKVKPSKASKSVTWKSSNSKVAKISSKGKVTAKKAGKATITAVSKTNKKVKATCKITVYSKPTKVSLNYSTKEIKTGESFQLKATVSPKKAKQTVTYSSSNSKIATVNKSGKVTGKKEGKVAITVVSTTNKSKKAKCFVYVSGKTEATATPNATKAPTSVPTATKVPTVTVTPTTTPTVTGTPTITGTPGDGNSGSDTYAGLSGPRTDAEGNVTYDCVYFGSYPQSDATGQTKDPIKWRILSINGTDAFLVADQNLDVYRYNEKYEDVTWETSTIRSWLNGYGSTENAYEKDYSSDNFIKKAFTAAEQAAIPYVTVVNEDNLEHGTEGGNDTLDKIYLLSIAEVSDTAYGFLPYKDENSDVIYDKARKRTNTAYVAAGGAIGTSYMNSEGSSHWWWLRSPGDYSNCASYVGDNGRVDRYGDYVNSSNNAVCPALHLNLSSTDVWSNAGTVTIERSVPTATKVPTVTVTPTMTPTSEPTVTNAPTVTPTTTPTVTGTPTTPETPDDGNSGSDSYAGLTGPRTDAEGNVTYDCVYFGSYPQSDATGQTKEPIKWRILSINGTDAFLVADQNLDVYPYNEPWTAVKWETSTIRSWLNGYSSEANAFGKDYSSDNFIDKAFTVAEQEAIPYVTVVNEDNPKYGTEGGNDTLDKIYLLSIGEVTDTAYGFLPYTDEEPNYKYDNARIRTNTAYVATVGAIDYPYMNSEGSSHWWWLRSPGYFGDDAAYVTINGYVYSDGSSAGNCSTAVCPALHLNLSSTDVWSNAGTVTIER